MKIAIGSDHGGFALKQELCGYLDSSGHQVTDVGTSSNEAVDYPIYARKVAELVAGGLCERGIMIDGAGIGSAMVANKVPGIRAAMVYDLSTAQSSREHNDANVLTLGAGMIGPGLAWQIVELWLSVDCKEDRHLKRVAMIEESKSLGPRAAVPTGLAGAATPAGPVVDSAGLDEADLRRILRELQPLLKDAADITGTPSTDDRGSADIEPTKAPSTSATAKSPNARPDLSPANIASLIDHTLLKPDATAESIRQLCAEARDYGFASVCVNSVWVPLVAGELRGSGVKTCSVVGFPLGAMPPELKAMETRRAIREGADEIDMVINIGALKRGDQDLLLKDIRAVVEACRDGSALCKVIIETCLLDEDEKRLACRLASRARAQFVKTSTGFAGGGATVEDVTLMADEVRDAGLGVKASGGIRNLDDVRRMIAAGATRIGASAGVAIVQEASAPAATGR